MKTEAMLKDPIVQLNLLLWMAKEQPATGYRVRPIFYQWGFQVIYIEIPFPFPEATALAIRESGLDISVEPEPDLILGRNSDNKALYLEAKSNSFGVGSGGTNCRQARAHFLASGPAFGEVFSPLDSCLLCYVVPKDATDRMTETLGSIHEQLRAKGLSPGPFSSHGIGLDKSRIMYVWDAAFRTHVGIDETEAAILDDVAEDTNPVPLLLVFSDQDCSNIEHVDLYRRTLIDQVRACLLSDLHRLQLGQKYETTPEKLLNKTSDGVFQYLGRRRQKGLAQLIRQNVLARIFEQWKDRQPGIKWSEDTLTIVWTVIGEKEQFMDWLENRRTKFEASKPSPGAPESGLLFSSPDTSDAE